MELSWISAWVPLAMLTLTLLELYWKFEFATRRGALLMRFGLNAYNAAIMGAYLGWFVALKPYEAVWFWNRILFAVTTFLVLIEFFTVFHIREQGLSSACFRLRWSEVASATWNGKTLKVRPKGKWLHPNQFHWQIPQAEVDALLVILRERLGERFREEVAKQPLKLEELAESLSIQANPTLSENEPEGRVQSESGEANPPHSNQGSEP